MGLNELQNMYVVRNVLLDSNPVVCRRPKYSAKAEVFHYSAFCFVGQSFSKYSAFSFVLKSLVLDLDNQNT